MICMLDETRGRRALNGNGAPLYEAIHKVTVIYVAGKTQNQWYYAELPGTLIVLQYPPCCPGFNRQIYAFIPSYASHTPEVSRSSCRTRFITS